MRERSGCGLACGIGNASERGEHPAGEKPSSQEAEHHEERQQDGGCWSEVAQEIATAWPYEDLLVVDNDGLASGHVAQQEQPHGDEQQTTGEQDEAGIAEGEFEANAQTWGSIHSLLPQERRLVEHRCGSRRRPQWR